MRFVHKSFYAAAVGTVLLAPSACRAQSAPPAAPAAKTYPDWVRRSNANADIVVGVMAKFAPEMAGQMGVPGLDDQIFDLSPGFEKRGEKRAEEVLKILKKKRLTENDPRVRQDLDILIKAIASNLEGGRLTRKYDIPYFDVSETIFGGLRGLLDDQVEPDRRKAALIRLRKYVGMEPGYKPLVENAERITREKLSDPKLEGPSLTELQKGQQVSPFLIGGIQNLFKKYKIEGYEEAFAKLKTQIADYNAFTQKEVLPKARKDFRLPPEMYAYQLRQIGVDIPPAQLAAMAHTAFNDIQAQMQVLAPKVAAERGWSMTDYRDVIKELKKEQLIGEAILPHYQKRLAQIEEIIRREKLVTLPDRPARIRIASAAEAAELPAPNMRPPRLLGNTGEQGEFVLPLTAPAPPGSKEASQKIDDFTYEAASWTLTAHEARPGHELQFATMVEKGISTARGIFSFNSTNVEGWGLYSEKIMEPFEPLEGQLITLQLRLLRSARAFCDPELQTGKVTPEQVYALLKNDVCLSEAMTNEEVERYTFRMPGQATSYFYGYTRLLELREEVQKKQGDKFDALKFHDAILAQGTLPYGLVRQGVLETLGISAK